MAASADLREELNCSICLSIYTDPVMLRCGHNFCRLCIDRVLDTQGECGAFSCPDCREVFLKRPALHRNLTLRNIAEKIQSSQQDGEDSGIFCSYCIHSPVSAVKSCLLCEASLCNDHLRVHSKSEEHVLSDPSASPGNRKCSIHKKVLMYYCTKDKTCICLSCCLNGEHRGHQVEFMNEASEKTKKKLQSIMEALRASQEKTDRRVKSLYEQRRQMPGKVDALQRMVNGLFRDLARYLEDLKRKVVGEITRQEKQVSLLVSDLIQQMEVKKEELTRKVHHIEELCSSADPVTILQELKREDFSDYEAHTKDHEKDGNLGEDEGNMDNLVDAVGDLDEGLVSVMLHKGLSDIMTAARKGLSVRWTPDVLLDTRTASNNVHISGDQKTASWSQKSQGRPEALERFQSYKVLSSTKFSSGRHFFEVEANKSGNWRIGLAYATIDRKGDVSNIGQNNKSWGLKWACNQLSVRHNCKEINLSPKLTSQRIGVYLDYEAGRMSFYEMSVPVKHLCSYMSTFTEPVYVVFALWNNAWVKV